MSATIGSMTDALIVYTTVSDEAIATRLAEALVAERVAACVQIVPGLRSIYRWHDAVRDDAEVQVVIKTSADRFAALSASLQRLHPYDVPEVVAVPVVAGSRAYLDWIARETRDAAAEGAT